MEFVGLKREKKRKRKRRNLSKKHRDKIKFEVKSCKHKKTFTESNDLLRKKIIFTMGANAFWENYKAGHEWQNRHNATWWKTRCIALQYENNILKDTIRNLVRAQNSHENGTKIYESNEHDYQRIDSNCVNNEKESNTDETFEFELNEDMMNFLAQSMRHKIELKNKKDSETLCQNNETDCAETGPNATILIHKRNKDARLLYGEASSIILAMETALQTTVEKHIDKSKPQYWPNIPLKL